MNLIHLQSKFTLFFPANFFFGFFEKGKSFKTKKNGGKKNFFSKKLIHKLPQFINPLKYRSCDILNALKGSGKAFPISEATKNNLLNFCRQYCA
jgi:hypothetical protein